MIDQASRVAVQQLLAVGRHLIARALCPASARRHASRDRSDGGRGVGEPADPVPVPPVDPRSPEGSKFGRVTHLQARRDRRRSPADRECDTRCPRRRCVPALPAPHLPVSRCPLDRPCHPRVSSPSSPEGSQSSFCLASGRGQVVAEERPGRCCQEWRTRRRRGRQARGTGDQIDRG